jgi:hypothetical protein
MYVYIYVINNKYNKIRREREGYIKRERERANQRTLIY